MIFLLVLYLYVAHAVHCDDLRGRYVGFGRGNLEDEALVQGIVNVMLNSGNLNGSAHVLQQGSEIEQFLIEGTYQATPSSAPTTHHDNHDDDDVICTLEAQITGFGSSAIHLRGYADGEDRLALVALNTTMLLELERAPTSCSSSSLGDQRSSLVSTSLVHDENSGKVAAAVVLQATVVQRNVLEYAYIVVNGVSDTGRTAFTVDSSCAVEFENGFVGAVFDDGFAYLGKHSGMAMGGTFDEN